MGKGNPHRQSGVGRNAGKGWKMERILESGGLALPEVSTRKDKKEKNADIIDLNSKRPVDANSIHSRPSIPVIVISTEPVAEVLDKAGHEKELVELEKEIAGFSPAERKFIDPMTDIDIYRKELFEAKNRIEKNGTLKRGWEEAIKESYIVKRLGWSNDRKLAPEKKEILGRFLELKLPVGIPEEKRINSSPDMKREEKKEKGFTPEQSSELLQWIGLVSKRFKILVEESKYWSPEFGDAETKKRAIFDKIKQEMSGVLKGDSEMEKLFSEEEIPRAVEHVMKYVEKFNFDIKK